MITVATLLWDANQNGLPTSSCYSEVWAERLYRGFARNLTAPFRFVCYSERERSFAEPIECIASLPSKPGYGDCIRPYELDAPMILVGLDTVITGNIDHLADFCLEAEVIGLPRDPYMPSRACNGVALVPAGFGHVWTSWAGENDMVHMRRQDHVMIDDVFPGAVQSFKGSVRRQGLGDTRIVYFHGQAKPHEPGMPAWIKDHWR